MLDAAYSLDDKYDLSKDRAFLTGVQALVRLPMLQRRLDGASGLNTAGFVTGYPGSPLASYDVQLRAASGALGAHGVTFQPGLNEDLAMTAVWGTQQVEVRGESDHDGVFALWYGKGAGLDRSGDALRHGNLSGSSPHGGVLLLLGDDHRAESSSVPHWSEYSAMDFGLPFLSPANIRELLEYGLYGIALSRFSGSWVGMKCTHDIVESAASVRLDQLDRPFRTPADFVPPPDGLHLRLPDTPLAQEKRMHGARLPAVRAFLRANPLDRTPWQPATRNLGIVTSGKTWTDLLEALRELGIDRDRAMELGIGLCKVGMTWPLDPDSIRGFCRGFRRILVIEEKRPFLETQMRALLYAERDAPVIIGKQDEGGREVFPAWGVLTAQPIASEIRRQLATLGLLDMVPAAAESQAAPSMGQGNAPLLRRPSFCAGCPHNRSTVVPAGSRGGAGTGCNYMVMWMDRGSLGYTQMGADGANWLGEAPFSRRDHVFQNMGDGTYNHSGTLSIRAAVQAGVNITFKILHNGVVAMTGGQAHAEALTVAAIARQVLAENVAKVCIVADDPSRHAGADLPEGASLHHRDDLPAVQDMLARTRGVSVLIYDQMCANEKRRLRRRGKLPDPPRHAVINADVCEGCGDCGMVSNCVAIMPLETPEGRKRVIDQSTCNKDFSCVEGFCPSFVTVEGGRLRKSRFAAVEPAELDDVPLPEPAALDVPFNLVLAGIGGTGVITLSSILGTAAHLDGRGCVTLDMMGLAQKGGAVTSHLRFSAAPEDDLAGRIPEGRADAVLGLDLLATVAADTLETVAAGHSRIVVDTAEIMPGDFARDPNLDFPGRAARQRLESAAGGAGRIEYLGARAQVLERLGDAMATNAFVLGYAWQRGLIPVSLPSVRMAFRLNGVAVDMNDRAFHEGRLAALGRVPALRADTPAGNEPLDALIARKVALLTAYQNAGYAARYAGFVARVRAAEAAALRHDPGDAEALAFTRAVAGNLARLMAYKDEYEVARLFTDGTFAAQIARQFEGDVTLHLNMAPPVLARRDPGTGRLRKRRFGPWMLKAMHLLAPLRVLRGTAFDPFGYTAERRMERDLIRSYRADIDSCLAVLGPETISTAIEIATLPAAIRGFGHVKEAAIHRAQARRVALLAQLRAPQGGAGPAA
jgi:indolepyruvate ferredoxin oxidoreductase